MPTPSSPADVAATVDQLRRAGCVFAEEEALLLVAAAQSAAELVTMVNRRVAGSPLEHVVGWASFCGVQVAVHDGVFIPRRRSEFLVQQAVALTPVEGVVVDLCCGSGAFGVAIAHAVSPVKLHSVDTDPAAAACARTNLALVGGVVYEGDLYAPLPEALRNHVEVVVASAPYVPTGEIRLLPLEARAYESPIALDGGSDGLDVVRRVIAEAPRWLAPTGHILVETSERQADDTAAAVTECGLVATVVQSRDFEATVVIGAHASE